jgi:hypothetical protein
MGVQHRDQIVPSPARSRNQWYPSTPLITLSDLLYGEAQRQEILFFRVHCRRFLRRVTRLGNRCSKRVEFLVSVLGLYFAHHNFVRIHGSLPMTPAMAPDVTDYSGPLRRPNPPPELASTPDDRTSLETFSPKANGGSKLIES